MANRRILEGSRPRRMYRLSVQAAALAVLLPLLVAADGASGQGQHDHADTRQGDPEERPEVASVAKNFGISRAEAAARLNRQPAIARLIESLEGKIPADRWGDAWADHDNGGVIVVAVTGDPSDFEDLARTEARRELPELESLIRMRQVDLPIADLEETWAQFKEDIEEWDALGAEFSVVGLYNDRNRIVVGMLNPGDPVTELMASRYGADKLVFEYRDRPEHSACRSVLDCDSMRGGIHIASFWNNTWHNCSAGFGATQSGVAGFLTAGHCGLINTDWSHNGNFYGTGWTHDGWHHLVDALWIRRTGGFPDLGDRLYATNSTTVNVDARYLGNNISDHRILCNTGYRTVGPECHNTSNGDIVITKNDPFVGPRTMYNQIELIGCGLQGDSGGPIYGHIATNSSAYAVAVMHGFKWDGPAICEGSAYVYGSYVVHIENHLGVVIRT